VVFFFLQELLSLLRSKVFIDKMERNKPKRNAEHLENKSPPPPKQHRISNHAFNGDYERIIEYVKKVRPRSLIPEEKLDILRVNAELRMESLERKKKLGALGQPITNIAKKAAVLLGRSEKVVKEVWKTFVDNQTIDATRLTGNFAPKDKTIPITKGVIALTQAFVRDQRARKARVVAKNIADMFVENGILASYSRDNKAQVKAVLRTTQRFIERAGFRRGNPKKQMDVVTKQKVVNARDLYLCEVWKNRSEGRDTERRYRRVFLDESYIHHHYKNQHLSIFNPLDAAFIPRENHKGRRYCFIAAIIEADPNVDEQDQKEADKAHVMLDTLDIFQGGSIASSTKEKKKETKDYHGMFNHDYFINWMQTKLFPALEARGVKHAVIEMDNAAYHVALPPDRPKEGMNKPLLLRYCEEYKLDVSPNAPKSVIWTMLKPIVEKMKPVSVDLAVSNGHRILLTPPYHSDLQPIELLWAHVKGAVGRQYDENTTLSMVKERLIDAFNETSSELVDKIIAHCVKIECKMRESVDAISSIAVEDEWDSDVDDFSDDFASNDDDFDEES
jgi:transposase